MLFDFTGYCPCGNPCEGFVCEDCRQEAEERAFLQGMNLPKPEVEQ